MGRKIEFDRQKAVARATDLFWKHGYSNTSMARLLKVMKLGEGSFYNSFGSKKALYMECVSHYNSVDMSARISALKNVGSTRDRIGEFFYVVAGEMQSNKNPGCLFSNSLSQELLSQKDFKAYMEKNINGFLGFLTGLIEQGQTKGEIRATAPATTLAKLLFTHLHGVHHLSVCHYDQERQRDETELFLAALLDQDPAEPLSRRDRRTGA